MRSSPIFLRSLFVGCMVAAAAMGRTPLGAAEPFEAFLEGLRRRQMFDMAQLYLDNLKSSNLVTDEIKQIIPYEQGRNLIEEARTLRDTALRMKRLEEARTYFESFIQTNPQHPLAAAAGTQLGNILLERGRTQLELSKRPTQAGRKDQLVAEARDFLAESQKVFDQSEANYAEELKKFPNAIDPKDRAQIAARDAARLNLLQARLFAATVLYETSKAYEPNTDQWKQLLESAAKKFGAIYQENEKIIAGLFARMWQGRCLQELGDLTQAITYYEQLLVQPDSDEFRDLKRKTMRYALECWIDERVKKYDEAIKNGEAWLKQARGQEDRTTEGLAIRWLTSLAYQRLAATLSGAEQDKANRSAAEHAAEVSKYSGEFQQQARELVAKHRKIEAVTEPANFADARIRAKNELDVMLVADSKIKTARSTKQNTEEIAKWQQERERGREQAVKYYQLALSLRDRETPIEAINDCRYYLCYLHYDAGRYLDAAIIGEFLARSYPQASAARPAAKIALASYLQSYNAAPPEERGFETDRMVAIAEYIGSKWPLEAEADEAWMILGDVAIRAQDLQQAADYLNRVRPESPRRGDADLKAGQAMWGAYQASMRLPADERPPQEELDKLVADAKETLQRGIQQMRERLASGGELTYTLLAAELALAQILVDTAQPDQAVAILERADTGILAQLAAGNPLAARGSFPIEAYKAALRGYVGTQRIEDAQRVMDALDQHTAQSPDAAATLTRVYVGLGLELEQQLSRLREEARGDELQQVRRGFELFLDRISAREEGATATSLNWVADTYFRLAEGGGDRSASSDAQKYYRKAGDIFRAMLQRSQQDPAFLSEAGQTAVRIRLAACERGVGNYQQALDQLAAILEGNPNALEAQVAAAETFQSWGELDPAYFLRAINGQPASARSPAEIWGWNKMAARLKKFPKYQEQFQQAQYNVAECSYRFSLAKAGKEKTDGLQKAAALIEALARLDPQMGGDEWRSKYDQLLKNIQRAAGLKVEGLTKPATSTAAASAAAGSR